MVFKIKKHIFSNVLQPLWLPWFKVFSSNPFACLWTMWWKWSSWRKPIRTLGVFHKSTKKVLQFRQNICKISVKCRIALQCVCVSLSFLSGSGLGALWSGTSEWETSLLLLWLLVYSQYTVLLSGEQIEFALYVCIPLVLTRGNSALKLV